MNIWNEAKNIELKVSNDINGGFDIVIEKEVDEELSKELVKFLGWVEENYKVQIMVLIDFVNKYYVLDNNKNRSGYLFYYEDFENYPEFNNVEHLPYAIIPCRGYKEKWSLEEILCSVIQALTDYFAWMLHKEYSEEDVDGTVEEILAAYMA